MGSSTTAIDQLNWPNITAQLDIEGYALLPGLLAPEQARDLARHTDTLKTLRRVSLASSDLGRGDLFYFDAGLPAPWSAWRATFYRYLAPVANRWNETLGSGYRYPPELAASGSRRLPGLRPLRADCPGQHHLRLPGPGGRRGGAARRGAPGRAAEVHRGAPERLGHADVQRAHGRGRRVGRRVAAHRHRPGTVRPAARRRARSPFRTASSTTPQSPSASTTRPTPRPRPA